MNECDYGMIQFMWKFLKRQKSVDNVSPVEKLLTAEVDWRRSLEGWKYPVLGLGRWLKMKVLVAQSCLTLCAIMDCSPPGSSVHGILQARILEWGAISYFRGSSQHRDRTHVSFTAGWFFTVWAPGEAHMILVIGEKSKLEFKCVLYFQGWFLTSKWIQALGCRQQDRCWGIRCVWGLSLEAS